MALLSCTCTLLFGNAIAKQDSGMRKQNFLVARSCVVACHHMIKYNLKLCVKCHYSLAGSFEAQKSSKNNTIGFEEVYNALVELQGRRLRHGILKHREKPIPNANAMGGTDYPFGQADWDPLAGQSVGGSEDCNRDGQKWLINCARRKTGLVGMGSVSYTTSKDFVKL